MKHPTLAVILGALPSLTAKERGTIRAACDVAARNGPDTHPAELVYAAMRAELMARMQTTYLFRVYKQRPDFVASSSFLLEYVNQMLKPSNRGEQQRAIRMLIRLLMDHMEGKNTPIDQVSVSWALNRIPACVDAAFPGYRESGLLPQILKKKLNGELA